MVTPVRPNTICRRMPARKQLPGDPATGAKHPTSGINPVITRTLMDKLKLKAPLKAWEYYYANFERLPHITRALRTFDFDNPLVDRNGRIARWATGIKSRKLSHFDIVTAIMRKTLNEWKLTSDINAETAGYVKTPSEVLKSGYGYCLELSYLFMVMARASGIKAGIVFTDRHAYNWVDINGRAFKVDFIDYFSTMKYEGAETYCYFNSDDNWLLKEPKATPMEIFTVHHYQKALRARKAGDNKMMERCFLASVGINPNTYYPNYYLGRFYFDRNMFKDAIKYFEQALASYPKGIEALTDMCCLYNLLRKPEAALKYIDRAILLAPTFAESWLRKGIVLQNMGKLHEAMQCFKKAIKLAAGDKKLIIVCDRNIDDIRRNFRPRRPSSAD